MIPLPKETKLKEVIEEGREAAFEVEALYPGYGVTVGNSLRRVLLSSLEGAAITQVNIEDVQHEYSTIEGVKEDVMSILLNLKQLDFKVHSDEPQTATLSVSGEKEVTAGDFDYPTQVEPVNPDAEVATLTTEDSELEMEVKIETGIGFVDSEELKEGKEEVGQITIDAIFTPVKSVNFDVENMRVKERTDFDRLTLEIETDGSITPTEAFVKACNILNEHFSLLEEPFDVEEVSDVSREEDEQEADKEEEEEKVEKKEEEKSIEELDLTTRIENSLKDAGIETVSELEDMDKSDLTELKGIGDKSAEKILNSL